MILLVAAVLLAPRASRVGFAAVVYPMAAIAWLMLRRAPMHFALVIALAIGLRVVLLVQPVALSDDIYRYLWDGEVASRGINPYAHAPDDSALASLRKAWHARINHPDIRTIYPPHAQALFAVAHDFTSWRVLVGAFDVMAICALRRRGLALAYATFPPLLFEGAWSGHVDAVAAAFVVLAMLYRSGLALGFATGLKIIPIAAAPAMTRNARFAIAFAASLLLPALPFLGKPFMPGFRDYATRWIYNSPLYDAVFSVAKRIPTKTIWTHHPLRFQAISDVVYRHVHPDFVTRAILAALAIGGIVLAGRSVSRAIGALLVCSPAIHPWYWLALAPAALIERSAWIAFALCAPFAYLTGFAPRPVVYALCYGLPLAYACSALSARVMRRVSAPRGSSFS